MSNDRIEQLHCTLGEVRETLGDLAELVHDSKRAVMEAQSAAVDGDYKAAEGRIARELEWHKEKFKERVDHYINAAVAQMKDAEGIAYELQQDGYDDDE